MSKRRQKINWALSSFTDTCDDSLGVATVPDVEVHDRTTFGHALLPDDALSASSSYDDASVAPKYGR